MSDKRAAKRKRYTGKIVTLKVGDAANEELTCHKHLLDEDSDFFRAALDQKWREGQQLEFTLPDDDHDSVTAYISWLYDGEIEVDASSTKFGEEDNTCTYLARLYCFGEKVQSVGFCNAVMDEILDTNDQFPAPKCPSFGAVTIMYDGTPAGSSGRQAFVKLVTRSSNKTCWGTDELKAHLELAADLIEELFKIRGEDCWHSTSENFYKEGKK